MGPYFFIDFDVLYSQHIIDVLIISWLDYFFSCLLMAIDIDVVLILFWMEHMLRNLSSLLFIPEILTSKHVIQSKIKLSDFVWQLSFGEI